MLLYKSVARRQTTTGFLRTQRSAELPPDLTSPVIQFLDLLAFGMHSGVGSYVEEADFLEKELRGRIELVTNAGAVNKYLYHPAGSTSPLTMALSSSLVTELAPVVSVLRHMSNFRVLILEEPEAHLHPRLQRKLAQVIWRDDGSHDGLFEAHVMECKTTVDQKTWNKVLQQVRWTFLRLRAVAGALGVPIQQVTFYTAYREDKLSSTSSRNPLVPRNPITSRFAPPDERIERPRQLQLDWENDYITLGDFEGRFAHTKIELDGRGNGSIGLA